MISVQNDVLDALNFKVKLNLNDSIHTLVVFLLGSFILIQNLTENFTSGSQISKVIDLIRINREVFLHALNDIFINDKE